MDRRYQVFVSSTFRDLLEERKAALDAILELGHFPAGMEIFPAADQTAWDLIARVIQDCDYYVLIVGGRYGSVDSGGISYTEKEYDLATRLGVPVLAFLHREPDTIPSGKSEMEPRARKKLDTFRKKVEKHHCKYWTAAVELKAAIALGLVHEIRLKPRVGWTRADGLQNLELLKQINDLRLRLDAQIEDNVRLKENLERVALTADLDQPIRFSKEEIKQWFGQLENRFDGQEPPVQEISFVWQALFRSIGDGMFLGLNDVDLQYEIFKGISLRVAEVLGCEPFNLYVGIESDNPLVRRVIATWIVWDLIEPIEKEYIRTQQGLLSEPIRSREFQKVWIMTRRGKLLFSRLMSATLSTGAEISEFASGRRKKGM